MSLSLCNSIGVFYQALTAGGLPLNAGLLYTYAAGTTNPQATFADSAGTLNQNPIVLDASGRVPGASEVWLTDGISYRLELRDSFNNVLKSQDDVTGAGSSSLATLATLAAPGGSALVGFSQTPPAVQGTAALHMQGAVSVKDAPFNAKGDGVTDDTAAIQAAWNFVIAQPYGKLHFPVGTYLISAPILIAPGVLATGSTIEGETEQGTTIKATAAMAAIFLFTDTGPNYNFTFRGIQLNGNALAQCGIKSTELRMSHFEHLAVTGTTVAAVQVGDGWDNRFTECNFYANTGDGLLHTSQANDLQINGCLFSANSGWAIKSFGGGPICVRGGAIQSNLTGGIDIVSAARPLLVDGVYFEANAQTGAVFTSPAKTIKTDIVVNGGVVSGTMSHAFPSPNVTVRNCLFNATFTECAVYGIAALSMSFTGNYCSSTAVPLLKTWGDNTFALPSNADMSGNIGFSKYVDVESVTTAKQLAFSTFSSDQAPRRNYVGKSVFAIPKIAGAAGSVLQRGAVKYNLRETFDVTGPVGDLFGIQIDTSVTTELSGALVYISAIAKSSAVTSGPRLTIGGKNNTASFAADTLYHHIEFSDFLPAAAAVNIGFSKIGIAGDTVTFADIVIAVVGAPDREFNRDLIKPVWESNVAPAVGTWQVGDTVINPVPVVGQPTGWKCTVAGTPGTFVAMANL